VFATPNLFDSARKKELENASKVYLYPWHFFSRDLIRNNNGSWELKRDKRANVIFRDLESRPYPCPPPRNTVMSFVNDHFTTFIRPQDRWNNANSNTNVPKWMQCIIDIDKANSEANSEIAPPVVPTSIPTRRSSQISTATTSTTTQQPASEMARQPAVLTPSQTPSQTPTSNSHKSATTSKQAPILRDVKYWKARAKHLEKEKKAMEENHRQQIAGLKRKYDEMMAQSKRESAVKDEKIKELEARIKQLEEEVEEMRVQLEECRLAKGGRPLRFADLSEGGVLSKHARAFTFFDTFEKNDAFLELLNYADGSEGSLPPGDGMCENLRPYSKVTMAERTGEKPPPSMDDEEYAAYLVRRNRARKEGAMTWKDDYLAYCIYVRAGTTQEFAAALVGISVGRMSDIFHEWNNVLDGSLKELFPRPTRSQMLKAFPCRTYEVDGHARNFLNLDATEIFVQKSSNNNVASSTYSDYKGHETAKFLAACDPIGCVWGDCVPDCNPGHISDVVLTADTKILRQVPATGTCKVDKGFLIENEAAAEGVVSDRPQKRLKQQVQQSSSDTALQQKSGNTRIVIENVNGGVKLDTRMLNVLIPCSQFGSISKVVRIAFLMQNFKKAIIQDRNI
jgi:hypothetical protein